MSNKNKKIAEDPMIQRQIQTEIWTIVLNHLASLAAAGREQELLMVGINTELVRLLKSQSILSLRSLSCDLTKHVPLLDIEQLCRMIVIIGIPPEAQEFLKLGANNRAFEDLLGIKGVDMGRWRKAIPAVYRQRCLPSDIGNQLWDELKKYGLKNFKEASAEQIVTASLTLDVSIAAIWDEICGKTNRKDRD